MLIWLPRTKRLHRFWEELGSVLFNIAGFLHGGVLFFNGVEGVVLLGVFGFRMHKQEGHTHDVL